jgi:UDP:flavonoid glycosyltransferase YjiC (YdhE family)
VGCFLTHGGWSSTCEGVAAGVPMLFWPGSADQYANATLACEVWRVGTRLSGELGREDVAARVREVMQSAAEVAHSAAKWRDVADKAAGPGGTSHGHMRMMVEAMVEDAAAPAQDNKAESFSPCSCAIL